MKNTTKALLLALAAIIVLTGRGSLPSASTERASFLQTIEA